jgi:hypothetical protein
VVLDKAGVRNAISVGEHEVVAFCFRECPVEDDVFSKSLVFMPKVVDGAG